MTEQDPSAIHRADQEAAKAEGLFWEGIRREEATTTLTQRQALTRRVNAQASLMEGLNVALWMALVAAVVFAVGLSVASIAGAL